MTSNKRPPKTIGTTPKNSAEDEQRPCDYEFECMTPFAELQMQPIHEFVLVIWRHLCIGYATDNFKTWDHTMDVAEERLGMVRGPAIVSRCVTLMRALRFDRSGGFNFLSPEFKQATKDEQALIDVVQVSQSSTIEPFSDPFFLEKLQNLVNSTTPVRTILAIHGLATICNECKNAKAEPLQNNYLSKMLN